MIVILIHKVLKLLLASQITNKLDSIWRLLFCKNRTCVWKLNTLFCLFTGETIEKYWRKKWRRLCTERCPIHYDRLSCQSVQYDGTKEYPEIRGQKYFKNFIRYVFSVAKILVTFNFLETAKFQVTGILYKQSKWIKIQNVNFSMMKEKKL